MTKTIRKLLGYLLVISLLLSCVSALAETGTVTVKVKKDETKGFNNADGILFEAYKVANSVGTGTTWEATSNFAAIDENLKKPPENGTQWSTAEADAMIAKIEAILAGEDAPKPDHEEKTKDGGKAEFDELDPGIYYIRKNPKSKTLLTGNASLIAVPFLSETNDVVTKNGPYDVEINAKYEFKTPEPISFPVEKIWDDVNNFDGIQPSQVKVHLHRYTLKADENGEEKKVEDEPFAALESSTKILNSDNGWKDVWENLDKVTEDNEEYHYEVTEDKVTGYDDPIIDNKTGKVTNPHSPKYGALVVTKQVTVNGQPTTSKMADGVYTFTITGPKDEDFKTNGTVKNEHNYLDNLPFSISITDGKANTWSHDKLMPGTYTIKETSTLTNGMTIAGGNAERTVKVTAENTAQSPATITYVNNLPVGSLKITKSVTVNGSATTGTRADGTYRFRVTGPSYPNGETVSIRIRNGKSVKDVQLDNLLLGEYEVTEIKTGLPSGVRYVSGDAKKTMAATNTAQNPLTFPFVNNTTITTTTTNPPRVTTPPPTTLPPESTATPTPTPSPTPAVNINGEKVWRDEGNTHNTRPTSIRVQLMRDGEQIREITVTGSGNRWSYSFGNLPKVDEQGAQYSYTVRETPVEGYTTTVRGTSIINDLEERTPQNYTNFTGTKIWKDDEDSSGERPNYITVRLLRDGREVDRRTVTAANGWQFTFQNVPLDDGYGNTYRYTIREDSVPGYVGRVEDFEVTNSRLPEREVLTEFSRYGTPLAGFGEPELEELLELYDYGTPLWGRPLQTGDELPLYPIVFGGIGCTALIALVVLMIFNKKKGRNAA